MFAELERRHRQLQSIRPRFQRLLPALLILLLCLAILTAITKNEGLSLNTTNPGHDTMSLSKTKAPDDLLNTCERYGFENYTPHVERPRRIYDLFMLSTELEWLEIRLHTLAAHVDYFVIVESDTTFTGLPKRLYLTENWNRFSDFHHQIIHIVVPDPGPRIGLVTWDHEDYLRNALLRKTFPTLVGTPREAYQGDVLIVSDVDEIPKPDTLDLLRRCAYPDRLTLRSDFYYYSFQWRHVGAPWPHPQATTYHGMQGTISPNDLRHGIGGPSHSWVPFVSWWRREKQKGDLRDAAWHCSSCFSTLHEMLTKLSSFSHDSLNTEENRDPETMMERVRSGVDLFGRKTETFERVEQNQDLPSYVLQNPDRFRYLLNRDGTDAGFTDWSPHPPT